jgi:two-component system, sensor histidine kinase and response regulator
MDQHELEIRHGTEHRVDAKLASPLARRRILSPFRFKLAFTLFVVSLLVGLSALIFTLVSRIFDEMTPKIRADLEWKARRGAAELIHTTELGLVLHDERQIANAWAGYDRDPDISAIVAVDADGKVIVSHGTAPQPVSQLFQGPPSNVRSTENTYVAWTESSIEGAPVGRVAIVVSKARLLAGSELKQDILLTAGIGALIALLATLGFVGFYVGPLIQVTESAFARLERTTQAALQAARLKAQFLANMSHEIRTPMNGVLGMIELLAGTEQTPKQNRYLTTLRSSAAALMTVLNDVLDFSKLDAEKVELRPTSTYTRSVLEDVAGLFAARAHLKQIELTCHMGPGVPARILVDELRLRQVLSNLVGNSVKFTDHGEITLRVTLLERTGEHALLRFAVADTGIGIPTTAHRDIFEAFSQVDGSLTRRHGGTGLGLAICRRVVKLLGGEIGLDSEPEQGSTFWFTVPVQILLEEGALPPAADRARTLIVTSAESTRSAVEELLSAWTIPSLSSEPAAALEAFQDSERADNPFGLILLELESQDTAALNVCRGLQAARVGRRVRLIALTKSGERLSENEGKLFDACLEKPLRAADLSECMAGLLDSSRSMPMGRRFRSSTPPRRSRPDGPRILVAEDNPVNQEVMVEMLNELGYQADVVENGRLALLALEKQAYPLVLMDCQMPELDGYATTRQIRSDEEPGEHVPIIAVTAHALQSERNKATLAGMDDYLTKPVALASLLDVIERWWPKPVQVAPESVAPPSTAIGRSPTVLRVFLKHVPGQLDSIIAAVDAGDRETLRHAAHKLKGSSVTVGLETMASLCARLESSPDDRSDLCAQLRVEFERARAEWLAKIPELSPSGATPSA